MHQFEKMKIRVILSIILLEIIVLSCDSPTNYIIPIDFDKYENEVVPGLTQEGVNAIQRRRMEEVQENSIGKELPNILIKDQENNEIELKSVLNEKTLIALTDVHCGWGMEGLTNDLPKALEKLESENRYLKTICLVIKTDSDYESPERFDASLDELKKYYSDLYIIDEKDSKRLNVYANPTRLLIHNNKLIHIGIGVSSLEGQYEELDKMVKE